MHGRPGSVAAGRRVRRLPPLANQQPDLRASAGELPVQTAAGRPHRTPLHLPGGGRLRGRHWDAHPLLPDPDCSEHGPGAGLRRRRLHHVEEPLSGVLRRPPDRLPVAAAVAEGLRGQPCGHQCFLMRCQFISIFCDSFTYKGFYTSFVSMQVNMNFCV